MAFTNSVTGSTSANGTSHFIPSSPSPSVPIKSEHDVPLQGQPSDMSITLQTTTEKVEALSNRKHDEELKFKPSEKKQTLQARCDKLEETCENLKEHVTYLEKKLERVLQQLDETTKDLTEKLSNHTHSHLYCPPASSYAPHPKPRQEITGRANLMRSASFS